MDMTGRLTTVEQMKTFATGGNAYLTLRSTKTGTRYTYRVNTNEQGTMYFVKVLYGENNLEDYVYTGHFWPNQFYVHGRKSRLPVDDVRAKAFEYFWNNVVKGHVPPHLEVWHEGRCCRCGRMLTVPESIADGIGPTCKGKSDAQAE